ncbi:hypothetical protein I2I05_17090 [Hymenobacter sp. BT683]|uniref:ABC transporter permease n=1 Tax=Hymenobacter jeongseonensis TaxID=2791027 RepID=A0ABS0IL63_9BACT|nr:hypothetical protein [Hymenobacter jeongseonensis]MBF9239122.1 hypothetical protein [Hymenobacter jeongseonensis]
MLLSYLIRRLFRRSGLVAVLVLLCGMGAAIAATLTLFTAAYNGTTVRVEWEVNTETDVTGFELARKAANESAYTVLSNVTATGQRRYQYLDANVYRTAGGTGTAAPTTGGPYTYRLTVLGPGPDPSYLTVLAGTPSAVQRSWGTIKSMFR